MCQGSGRPAGRAQLEVADLEHSALGQLDPPGGGQDLVHLELVVVAGADEHPHLGALELLVGHRHPPPYRVEHPLVEQRVQPRLVALEFGQLVGIGAERVVAAPDHVPLELGDGVLAGEFAPPLLQRPVPAPATVGDHGNERLAGHVTAEDDHVGAVVARAVEKLAPARL